MTVYSVHLKWYILRRLIFARHVAVETRTSEPLGSRDVTTPRPR